MPQGDALITPLAYHHFAAPPHIEPIKGCFTAAWVLTDNFDSTGLKSSDQLSQGAHISSWLAAMEWQHDDKSQEMQDQHN
jgi:hypothetical protein